MNTKTYVYIGCRTTKDRNARGKGISLYEIKEDKWELKEIFSILENPSYLCIDNKKEFLYTVHGDMNDVSSFKIKEDGKLEFLNTVRATGRNPVFITTTKNNKFLIVATLQGGTIAMLPILKDGSLAETVFVEKLEGLTENGVSHAHQCYLDKTGKFLFAPTQGRQIGHERIFIFSVDEEKGKLIRLGYVQARTYSEPRHVAISENNKFLYLVNEKGNTITFYEFDEYKGELKARQILSTLPETYTAEGQASAVVIHPNGEYLYASNRIHESIAIFKINKNTGFLTLLGFTNVLGKTPRFIMIHPNKKQLIVANEDSDTIKIFDIDEEYGTLKFSGLSIETESPTCVTFYSKE
ncbi:MAG: lactonase family protein [Fusobacterium gastrosuis]|uniref:lactonase family protein n=3 Tax=Fusobacteriaceae TaxID=203492 RepID=UPI0025BEB3DF|nr:lactonase family protein [Fusobacterium sp.]MCI7224350.1 lactonase family protein [Fusobacterium sp.]MDY4010851.1 lactonase family protein [Fusobacterium gastrosuis]MDY5795702.1 lactonase family protein [Fusobacterium gastrosuis]